MGKKAKRTASDERATGGSGAGEEFELKLDVEPASLDALMRSPWLNSDAAVDRAQESVYFDTPDRALNAAGFSLRVRTIGDRHIETVKAEGAAAAGLFVRPEWERTIDRAEPVLDGSPLRGVIAEAELERIGRAFAVSVMRKTVLVERPGASIELVFDRGTIRAGDRAAPVHEIELELKHGDAAALFAFAREIDETAPVRLGVLTKSERGYRLGTALPDKPAKAAPLALDADATTRAGFQAIVGACLRQFRLNEAILMRTGSGGALHQARVALRRLRSALSTFRHVVDDDRYDPLRIELRWIAAALGEARNLDVLLERIDDDAAAAPLRAAHGRAYADVQTALASARLRHAMLDLSEWTAIGAWLSDPATPDARDQPIAAFAATALERHRRRLKRLGRKLDRVDDAQRHAARIEAKKLRYATEFFAGLFGGKKATRRHKAFSAALETLQTQLGDLNDLATAPQVLADLDLLGTPTAFALQPDLSRRGPLLDRAVDAYDQLMDSKPFWR
ncbi:CHAD domain-containing protein [Sphingomonas sp. PB2P19]|uniref:CYTH and CHAD domain-containing protein n=1 Tax=Sphingomonas rhamnosi TaxID=3096156 RepID=UPI002FC67AD1